MKGLSALRRILTHASLGIVGSGIVPTAAVTPEPQPSEIRKLTLEDARNASQEKLPACAKEYFLTCNQSGDACSLQIRMGNPDEPPEVTACRAQTQDWQARLRAARDRIVDLDPLPRCFEPESTTIFSDNGVSPNSPERNIFLLQKGVLLGDVDCTQRYCDWIRRNAANVGPLTAACDRLLGASR